MGIGMTGLGSLLKAAENWAEQDVWMPVLFIGHGSPMNIVADNAYTRSLSQAGTELPTPKAILVVSAHWLTRGTYLTATDQPRTIHDFYGFPDELYDIHYQAPGTPGGAKLAGKMLERAEAKPDRKRGLDHGAWSVLRHMYPAADIPVFQLSIDRSRPLDYMYRLAALLKDLRKKGILVIGSGNITHNLRQIAPAEDAPVMDWAEEFDAKVKNFVLRGDHQALINYANWGELAKMAHPSNDHYLPLIYSLGLQREDEQVQFIHEGFQHGSISMRCFRIG